MHYCVTLFLQSLCQIVNPLIPLIKARKRQLNWRQLPIPAGDLPCHDAQIALPVCIS
jgi:hypothetical protein